MQIKFFGVRGSYPVPGPDTVRYGGNTTCVSISKIVDGTVRRIILDCGTGIVQLGKEIINNYFTKKEYLDQTILFTHLHPDHTQGFPFFAPNFFPSKINLYGMNTLRMGIEEVLSQAMIPPNFPIEYKNLKSARKHFEVSNGEILLEDPMRFFFKVECMQAYAPSHPQQGAIYYKITELDTGKSVACIWDNESKVGGDKAVINFVRGCDTVIHDTQYTKEEYENDKIIVQGFGHSTYEMALENTIQAGVKRLVCIHYNPAHTDTKLNEVESNLISEAHNRVLIYMAREGTSLEI
jgi:phosphoribosyl 1,2-cyclic phosphodiesterase